MKNEGHLAAPLLLSQGTAVTRYSNPCIALTACLIKIESEVPNDQKSEGRLQSTFRENRQKSRRPLQNQSRSRKTPAPGRILQAPQGIEAYRQFFGATAVTNVAGQSALAELFHRTPRIPQFISPR